MRLARLNLFRAAKGPQTGRTAKTVTHPRHGVARPADGATGIGDLEESGGFRAWFGSPPESSDGALHLVKRPARAQSRRPDRARGRSSDGRTRGSGSRLALLLLAVPVGACGQDPAAPSPPRLCPPTEGSAVTAPRAALAAGPSPEAPRGGALAATRADLSSAEPLRVLFIGNSLTADNDLPELVRLLAAEAGEELEYVASVVGGASLDEHWNTGPARTLIADGDFDVVVLQQGPSSLPESREHLVTWTQVFTGDIRAAGGEPALYMVWPSRDRAAFFEDVSGSYRAAAEVVHGILFPVGDAWRVAWCLEPGLALYGPDDFHPSVEASYLAAAVMMHRLFGRDPRGLTGRLRDDDGFLRTNLSAGMAALLQEAAVLANRHYGF